MRRGLQIIKCLVNLAGQTTPSCAFFLSSNECFSHFFDFPDSRQIHSRRRRRFTFPCVHLIALPLFFLRFRKQRSTTRGWKADPPQSSREFRANGEGKPGNVPDERSLPRAGAITGLAKDLRPVSLSWQRGSPVRCPSTLTTAVN